MIYAFENQLIRDLDDMIVRLEHSCKVMLLDGCTSCELSPLIYREPVLEMERFKVAENFVLL